MLYDNGYGVPEAAQGYKVCCEICTHTRAERPSSFFDEDAEKRARSSEARSEESSRLFQSTERGIYSDTLVLGAVPPRVRHPVYHQAKGRVEQEEDVFIKEIGSVNPSVAGHHAIVRQSLAYFALVDCWNINRQCTTGKEHHARRSNELCYPRMLSTNSREPDALCARAFAVQMLSTNSQDPAEERSARRVEEMVQPKECHTLEVAHHIKRERHSHVTSMSVSEDDSIQYPLTDRAGRLDDEFSGNPMCNRTTFNTDGATVARLRTQKPETKVASRLEQRNVSVEYVLCRKVSVCSAGRLTEVSRMRQRTEHWYGKLYEKVGKHVKLTTSRPPTTCARVLFVCLAVVSAVKANDYVSVKRIQMFVATLQMIQNEATSEGKSVEELRGELVRRFSGFSG
ncbi:hypothetical protein N9L68_01690 [bacterium]|nr:hypothetical protein [bacterium]